MSRKILNELVLDISRDVIDVTPIEEPDPRWKFTDSKGHRHKWEIINSGSYKEVSSVPTCSAKTIVVGMYPDGSDRTEIEYRCLKCNEVIDPRWKGVTFRRFAPGVTSAYLDGVMLSESEAKAVAKVMEKEA